MRVYTIYNDYFVFEYAVMSIPTIEYTVMFASSSPVQDGLNSRRQSLDITVGDVQDSPPQFTSTLTAVLDEGVPVGSEVVKLEAVDRDRDNPRTIRYSLQTSQYTKQSSLYTHIYRNLILFDPYAS